MGYSVNMNYLYGQVFEDYSDHNLRRLSGEIPEKESSKAVNSLIKDRVFNDAKILEVGCSVGHIVRTLSKLNCNLTYFGIDIDEYAIQKGKGYFQNNNFEGISSVTLANEQAEKLPFPDNSFDGIISLNVLEHLKEPTTAINEFVRCASKFVLIRTLLSDQTFIVQEVRNKSHSALGYSHLKLPDVVDELDHEGKPKVFIYQNVYSKDLIEGLAVKNRAIKAFQIFEDDMYSQEAFDLDSTLSALPRATKVIGGKQVRGLFVDTNYWIILEK